MYALALPLLTAAALSAAGAEPADFKIAPEAAALLAKAKAAAGGEAWDKVRTMRTTFTIKTSGLTGTADAVDDLEHGLFLDHFALGPVTGAQGYDGKLLWSQDSSKQVREESGGDARLGAADDAYRRRVAYWYPERARAHIEARGLKEEGGRKFQVLTITPEGGRPFDMWIDAETYLIDRVIEKAAMETRTTLYSDYRVVHGVKLPHRVRATNGEEKYDQFVEINEVALGVPAPASLFAMPAPPPPDFSFAEGRTSTTVPFTLVNNHIYVDVKVNGHPLRLLCDTGGANIVTPTVAKQLGLQSQGALQGRGVGEKSEDVGVTKVETVTVGDATVRDQVFAVYPMEEFAKVEGLPIAGLIGYEIFKRFVVEVNYQDSRLTLTLPSAFQYRGKGTAVPFQFNSHIPQVDGEIDGIAGKFDIDTGSRASVDLLRPFAEKHDLRKKYGMGPSVVTGWGVGGPARSYVGRSRVLKLGSVAIAEPVTMVSAQEKGAFSDPYVAGNVGGGVLKRFNVTFDYERKVLYLEPNANFPARDAFDHAGMWVNLDGDGFAVVDVLAGGPAEAAGLKAGDRIVTIDGGPAKGTTLYDFRGRLLKGKAGDRVALEVESGGKRRAVVLVLREIV